MVTFVVDQGYVVVKVERETIANKVTQLFVPIVM